MPQTFTPDELKALVESGDLKTDDLKLLDPSDAKVASMLMMKSQTHPLQVDGAPMWLPAAGGPLVNGAIDTAKSFVPSLKSGAVGAVGMYGLKKASQALGLPSDLTNVLETMFAIGSMGGGKGGGGAAAEAEAEAGAAGRAVTRRTPTTPVLDPKQMGGMTDEEVIAAYKNAQQPRGVKTIAPEPAAAPVKLRTPDASPVQPPADIEARTRPDWLHQDVAPGPFVNPKANLLRPDESVIGLLKERYPQLNVTAPKEYPRPTGDDPLSNAVRQRNDIASKVRKRTPQ